MFVIKRPLAQEVNPLFDIELRSLRGEENTTFGSRIATPVFNATLFHFRTA